MKTFRYIAITLCVILSLGACKKDKVNAGVSGSGSGGNEGGGGSSSTNVTLTTQAQVNEFGAKKQMTSLTIDGSGITDLSGLNVQTVNTLTIKNTSIEVLRLPTPTSVLTKLVIENNPSLTAIPEMGLTFSSGDIVIKNNTALTDISGFLGLKRHTGRFTVEGNTALGEDKSGEEDTYGFNVIKKLISTGILTAANVTLSNNHPAAVTDPTLIGQGSNTTGYYSYEITSDLDALNFAPKGKIIQDLTITGPLVTDEGLGLIADQIETVKGNVVIDGVTLKSTEHLFSYITCEGSITLKNIATYDEANGNKFFNTNGFKDYTEIKGDLILENIPYLVHWGAGNSFAQIKTIGGNLVVRNCGMQQLAFMSLEKVEGNVTFDNNCINMYTGYWWNLSTNLTYIGGDLTITGNDHVNGLGGYEKLEYIGGNVLIRGNGTAPEAGGGIPATTIPNQVGFNLVQDWINNGVVQNGKTVECYMADGTAVQFTPKN